MDMKKAKKILGVEKMGSEVQIKKIYKDLARKWHPDINSSNRAAEKMRNINKAYAFIMKERFDVVHPWKDYQKWLSNQFENDPIWGNISAGDDFGKTKRYPGVKKASNYIEHTKSYADTKIKDFLDKRNVFAVVGVSRNPKKYGNKVYKDLKFSGYNVYPINPKIDNIDGDKCYDSLSSLPKLPDVISLVVPPKIARDVIKQAVKIGIKNVWLQPGSESKEIIGFCHKHNLNVLYGMCIMIEKRKFA